MTLKLRTSWWMESTMLRFAWRCLHTPIYYTFTYVFGCICRYICLELANESSYWGIWTSRWSTIDVFVGIWAPYLSECYQCQYLVSLLFSSSYSFQKISCFFPKLECLTAIKSLFCSYIISEYSYFWNHLCLNMLYYFKGIVSPKMKVLP